MTPAELDAIEKEATGEVSQHRFCDGWKSYFNNCPQEAMLFKFSSEVLALVAEVRRLNEDRELLRWVLGMWLSMADPPEELIGDIQRLKIEDPCHEPKLDLPTSTQKANQDYNLTTREMET